MSKLKIAIEAVRKSGLKINSSALEDFLAGVPLRLTIYGNAIGLS